MKLTELRSTSGSQKTGHESQIQSEFLRKIFETIIIIIIQKGKMMKAILYLSLFLALPLFHGCATAPQSQVNASEEFWSNGDQTVGVYVTPIPEVKGHISGAGCLLCIATASALNSGLNTHMQSQSNEDLLNLQSELIKGLQEKGVNAVAVEAALDLSKIKKFPKKQNFANKDFRPLKDAQGIDQLLIVDLSLLGTMRNFSGYIPAGEPYALIRGLMYIVNLEDNGYEFYEVIDVAQLAGEEWNEDGYPGITNAYYTALELGKASAT